MKKTTENDLLLRALKRLHKQARLVVVRDMDEEKLTEAVEYAGRLIARLQAG